MTEYRGWPRRHPLEVTSDRLADEYRRYYTFFSGAELDAISLIRHAYDEIASGSRGKQR